MLRQAQTQHTSTNTNTPKRENTSLDYQQYAVFRKTPPPPSNGIREWTALLDGALPPHLRDPKVSPALLTLSATDLAEVLLAAQRGNKGNVKGNDLLFHLGFEQGRWSAVVWLIKKLVDRFPIAHRSDESTLNYLALWKQVTPFPTPSTKYSPIEAQGDSFLFSADQSYAALKNFAHPLQLESAQFGSNSVNAKSLNELTDTPGEDVVHEQNLAHDALGQIWRTLGAMTRACAGSSIRQEVLEIIAYLHHREIMPTSIYQYQPRMDKSAIQQPPLIPLLSSRILTSLSDAAWRAHEKLLVEEARVRLGDRSTPGPAVLAAPYRARVDELFPEVWLELILWSCLHGGWIKEGGHILNSVTTQKNWKPLSWREYEKTLPPTGQLNSNDWDAWDYLFKTKARGAMDPPEGSIPEVQRTVSAEVVNAYIDAIAGLPSEKQLPAGMRFHPVQKLSDLKKFLAKRDLGLTTGSWDALAIRVIENHGEVPEKTPKYTARIVELSPGLGQGLKSMNTQDLPAYVLDSGLAMQGILNRALHGRAAAGNLQPALMIFRDMLARTDRDKQTSMTSFMEGSKPLLRALGGHEMFTSNVTGIDYPAFNLQIPTTTLALFLDLVTQSKEYEFGRWLLYNHDADEPVIRDDQYNDPFLLPALVRFAASTQDSRLFATLRALPNFSIYLVLDAQMEAHRWDAATGIVEYMPKKRSGIRPLPRDTWTMSNLANLARVMLLQVPGAVANQAESRENLQNAKRLFSIMVEQVDPKSVYLTVKVQTLLGALASVDEYWAKFCINLRLRSQKGHHEFLMTTLQFNNLLEGVLAAYGSTAGRRLLNLFWPRSSRRSYQTTSEPAFEARNDAKKPRIAFSLPGASPEHRAVMYGALAPNVKTITMILQKALEELRYRPNDEATRSASSVRGGGDMARAEADDELVDVSERGLVAWTARQMADLPDISSRSDVIFNIGWVLRGLDMDDLHEALPEIVKNVESQLLDHSGDEYDAEDGADPAVIEEEARLDSIEGRVSSS